MHKMQLSRRRTASWEEQMEKLNAPLLPTLDIGSGTSPLMFRIPGSVTMNLNKKAPPRKERVAPDLFYDNPQADLTGDASKRIPLPDNSVGNVMMHHTIGPMNDPYAESMASAGVITPEQMVGAATEILRVLVNGGKLYIYSGHLQDPAVIRLYIQPLRSAGFSNIDYSTSKHEIDDELNKAVVYEESLYEEIGGDQPGGRRESFGGLIVATK